MVRVVGGAAPSARRSSPPPRATLGGTPLQQRPALPEGSRPESPTPGVAPRVHRALLSCRTRSVGVQAGDGAPADRWPTGTPLDRPGSPCTAVTSRIRLRGRSTGRPGPPGTGRTRPRSSTNWIQLIVKYLCRPASQSAWHGLGVPGQHHLVVRCLPHVRDDDHTDGHDGQADRGEHERGGAGIVPEQHERDHRARGTSRATRHS